MAEAYSTLAKPTILVVEDEAPLMTLLRYNLEKQGFKVEEAADGQEALLRVSEALRTKDSSAAALARNLLQAAIRVRYGQRLRPALIEALCQANCELAGEFVPA